MNAKLFGLCAVAVAVAGCGVEQVGTDRVETGSVKQAQTYSNSWGNQAPAFTIYAKNVDYTQTFNPGTSLPPGATSTSVAISVSIPSVPGVSISVKVCGPSGVCTNTPFNGTQYSLSDTASGAFTATFRATTNQNTIQPINIGQGYLTVYYNYQQPNAEELMNWAEVEYAQYFSPHQTTQTSAPYVYRYYPNGNYLGLSGSTIYIWGPVSGNAANPVSVGVIKDYTCRVYPNVCTRSKLDYSYPFNQ